jgi:hypothetical protein
MNKGVRQSHEVACDMARAYTLTRCGVEANTIPPGDDQVSFSKLYNAYTRD